MRTNTTIIVSAVTENATQATGLSAGSPRDELQNDEAGAERRQARGLNPGGLAQSKAAAPTASTITEVPGNHAGRVSTSSGRSLVRRGRRRG